MPCAALPEPPTRMTARTTLVQSTDRSSWFACGSISDLRRRRGGGRRTGSGRRRRNDRDARLPPRVMEVAERRWMSLMAGSGGDRLRNHPGHARGTCASRQRGGHDGSDRSHHQRGVLQRGRCTANVPHRQPTHEPRQSDPMAHLTSASRSRNCHAVPGTLPRHTLEAGPGHHGCGKRSRKLALGSDAATRFTPVALQTRIRDPTVHPPERCPLPHWAERANTQ